MQKYNLMSTALDQHSNLNDNDEFSYRIGSVFTVTRDQAKFLSLACFKSRRPIGFFEYVHYLIEPPALGLLFQ